MKDSSNTLSNRLKEKPIHFNARITLENKKYLTEILHKHKRDNISDALRYVLANAQELKFYGIDVCDADTTERLIKR